MNNSSNISTVKKQALCRYFVANGTCFYGGDCQFVHDIPSLQQQQQQQKPPEGNDTPLTSSKVCEFPLNPLQQDLLENIVGCSSGLDFYLPYSHQNGLLPESKLSTYISGGSSERKSAASLADAFSSLGLDPFISRGSNPAANEFVPRATTTSSSAFHAFGSALAVKEATIPFSSRMSHGISLSSNSRSPLSSPGRSPHHSPLLKRCNSSPAPTPQHNIDPFAIPTFQSVDGTTYFYPAGGVPPASSSSANDNSGVVLPDYTAFPFTPANVLHMKPKANAPSFFMPDELRLEILHRHTLTMAHVDPHHYPDLPLEVDNYHNLLPLETHPSNPLDKSSTFGYTTSVYKATNVKTGLAYCLRRIKGFRMVYPKAMSLVDMWKNLQHSNVVQLREVFTTKAFGEHSIVFVHDYHPGAETLMAKHFSDGSAAATSTVNGLTVNAFRSDKSRKLFPPSKVVAGEPRQHAGLLPESLIWAYVVQLCSAIRTIHAAGLACRILDPTKILITSKSRLRVNCCGIYDVLALDPNQSNPLALMQLYQQDDLVSLGKLVLALACNTLFGLHSENLQTSMELVARNYSSDLRNLIVYLLSNHNRPRSVNDIMPMIGARFFTQLDAAHMRGDVIENELAKEVESGRLFRLVSKLGIINERPEFNLDPAWCETGDRYMLKLFRDYLFHQVTEDGRPWIDVAHIVQCLNKLDAGVPEKVCLMSRDEQNVLVVSYAELKQCFESSFAELLTAAAQVSKST